MEKNKEWLKKQIAGLITSYTSFGGPTHYSISESGIKELDALIDEFGEPEENTLLYTVFLAKHTKYKLNAGMFLYKENGKVRAGDNFKVFDPNGKEFQLTEKEIKDYDAELWQFAKGVKK